MDPPVTYGPPPASCWLVSPNTFLRIFDKIIKFLTKVKNELCWRNCQLSWNIFQKSPRVEIVADFWLFIRKRWVTQHISGGPPRAGNDKSLAEPDYAVQQPKRTESHRVATPASRVDSFFSSHFYEFLIKLLDFWQKWKMNFVEKTVSYREIYFKNRQQSISLLICCFLRKTLGYATQL